ncbi:MAG: acyl-CoA synthetase [Pseudohongiellaceae bacterium]|nr:acyl-CoA synthetase [Pseudohongiellaceae bacterium]
MIDLSKRPLDNPLLENVASVEVFERAPLYEQFPCSNSYELLQQSAKEFGDDTAIEFLFSGQKDAPTQSISFRELAQKITQTGNLLHSLGLSMEDSVSIMLPILPQSHPAIWGSQSAAISNPINPMLEPEHIAEIISAAESKVIICLAPSEHSDIWQKVQQVLPKLDKVHTILAVHLTGLTQAFEGESSIGNVRVLDFDTSIADQESSRLLSGRRFSSEQVAAYFHTGGTTGRPKIAKLTHGNMAFIGQLMQVYTAHIPRHTVLCGLPLFHIYGVIIQGISAFAIGVKVVLLTPSGFRNPEAMKNFWNHVERFKVRAFSTVPTVLTALSQIPVGDADTSSLQTINSGAAPLSPTLEHSFEKKHNVEISNGYGMTETTALISRAPQYQPEGSVGFRLPYSQIRIVHLADNIVTRECDTGESGVVTVRGPQVFAGYKEASDNANAWVEGGWFNTGDMGFLDEDGFLHLSGRAKDLIIRGGHNIDPAIIEDTLDSHEKVASAVAVGQPDSYAGELPMAFVVLKPGVECTVEELRAYCEEHIAERAAIPRRIEFVDAMPLTSVGKIFKPKLRQKISEMTMSEALAEKSIKAKVSSRIDKRHGMVVIVELEDKSQLDEAKTTLGAYAIALEIS